MGRLEQQQRKQSNRMVLFSVIVFFAVLILLLTFGLRILLNSSAFVARLTEKKSDNQIRNRNLISDVDIDDIPMATNSAKIIVGGSVINFETVEFYLNGDIVKETQLVASDTFTEEIGDLTQGENEVYVIAKTKDGSEEKKSRSFTVIYKNEKPKLEVSEPQENAKTSNSEIKVAGSTDKEIYVRINDLPVVVDAQGHFQTLVRLKEGENKIKVTAQDVASNSEEKTITVFYEKD